VEFAVHGGEIDLATSREASRYKIVRTSLSAPDFATATVVVPQSEFVVEQLHPAKDALYVQFTRGGAGRIGRLSYAADAKLEMLPLPEGFPSARVSASDPDVDGVLVQTSAWTRAGLTSSYDPRSGSLTDTGLSPK